MLALRLESWLRALSQLLVPGGRYVTIEFHPLSLMFDDSWRLVNSYFGSPQPVPSPGVPDYVAEAGDGLVPWGYTAGVADFVNPHPDFTFQWSLGEIVSGLLRNRFRVTTFEEYPYCNGAALLPGMRALPGRWWARPLGMPELPLMFGLVAHRA